VASDERRVRARFVSIREAYHYLGCSRSHLYAELLPKIKTVTLGKRRLIDFDSLEELADKLIAAAPPPAPTVTRRRAAPERTGTRPVAEIPTADGAA
jgi:hypothetical protein